jgi:hypothetical protein
MSIWLRRAGGCALAGLVMLGAGGAAQAQRNPFMPASPAGPAPVFRQAVPFPGINPNFQIAPGLSLQQFAFNTATLGRAFRGVPPWALGFNPFLNTVNVGGTVLPGVTIPGITTPGAITSPGFGLSTIPSVGNPWLGGGGGGGYGLSTVPSYGSEGGFGSSGYGGYGGYYGDLGPSGYLRGMADMTNATGRYWMNIQQARLLREQANQSSIETARRRLAFEAELERMRPTAQTLRDRELATELNRARRDPPATEVFSGRALNELLRGIRNASQLNRGPNVPLDEDTLKHINLAVAASRGNVGMLKNDGKLNWPLPLQDSQFDELRKKLSSKLMVAVAELKNKDLQASTVRDVNAYYRALLDKLNNSADELSPSQYIEAKRFLNNLGDAVRALSDPRVANYFDNTWTAKGKNVAELVQHLTREGLQFAPAAPGDEAAYTALFHAMRAFDAGLQVAQK